ncbi:MAG: hypothetical protein RLZZ436_4623 [Planctomycetota bacterium]
MSNTHECFPGFGHQIGAIIGGIGYACGDHQGEAGHFPSEFGDDAFGHGGADARESTQGFHILFFDGNGDFADGADHGAKRFFDTDAVDGADLFEEFEFRIVHETDDAGCKPALLWVTFEEFDGAKADFLVELGLQLSADDIREQDFIVEASDAYGGSLFGKCDKRSGDAIDQESVSLRTEGD